MGQRKQQRVKYSGLSAALVPLNKSESWPNAALIWPFFNGVVQPFLESSIWNESDVKKSIPFTASS
jgi:hypothetical protein